MRMLDCRAFWGLIVGLGCAACGAPRAAAPPTVLPLATLRLYETGIGYFERSGTLSPTARAGLPVPASHLDDALRSLVVLTPGQGDRLRGVQFASRLSRGMARALAGLAPAGDGPIAYRDLLGSLRGTHVEVTTSTQTLQGRLVDLEGGDCRPDDGAPSSDRPFDKSGAAARDKSNAGAPDDAQSAPAPAPLQLLLASDTGSIVRVAARDVRSVRPTDRADLARLDAAIDAQSTRAAQNEKVLDVLSGARGTVTLGYVAEAPVWRTTYRVLLDDSGPATLQAWALVHNDTDEDWHDVHLQLANGRPDSFLFPLAAPRYARRELVHPDDALSTVPQLLDRTADTLWGDSPFDGGGLDLSGEGKGGGGEGMGLGRIGGSHGQVRAQRGMAGTESSSLLSVGDLAKVAQASGVEAGALFVYTMPAPLALGAHASALVPFLQQTVDAAPIAWVPRVGEPARAGVRFVNSTAQTLPAGTVAFLAGGGFAGESGLDRLKPGERRFLTFGADLDVAVDAVPSPASTETEAPQRLTWERGALVEHYLRTVRSTCAFVNRTVRPRAVYLGLAIQANARVTGADAVDYDAVTSTPVAIVRVDARGRVEREIATVEGLSRSLGLDDLTSEALARLVAAPTLAPSDRGVATEALAREKELEQTRNARKTASEEVDAIEKELERLRDDAKALGGEHGAPPAELGRRLLSTEDRYASARKRVDALEIEEKARTDRIAAVLARLAS
jgi:hypothetical protein